MWLALKRLSAVSLVMVGFVGASASGASLGFNGVDPSFTVDGGMLIVTDDGGTEISLDIIGEFATGTSGTPGPGDFELTLFANFFLGPTLLDFGFLDVTYDGGSSTAIEGTLVDFGEGPDTIELLFDVDGGDFTAEFGPQVLVEIVVDGIGMSPLTTLDDPTDGFGEPLGADFTVSSAEARVPLPASFALLLGGLGLLALQRRGL